MSSNPSAETLRVADQLVALWRAGKLLEAGEQFWAPDVVSIERFQGDMARLTGRKALAEKGNWWAGAHEIHSIEVGDPYVNGDQFIVRFVFDVTVRQSGKRMSLDELASYTIRGGRIVEEKYFVLKQYFSG